LPSTIGERHGVAFQVLSMTDIETRHDHCGVFVRHSEAEDAPDSQSCRRAGPSIVGRGVTVQGFTHGRRQLRLEICGRTQQTVDGATIQHGIVADET